MTTYHNIHSCGIDAFVGRYKTYSKHLKRPLIFYSERVLLVLCKNYHRFNLSYLILYERTFILAFESFVAQLTLSTLVSSIYTISSINKYTLFWDVQSIHNNTNLRKKNTNNSHQDITKPSKLYLWSCFINIISNHIKYDLARDKVPMALRANTMVVVVEAAVMVVAYKYVLADYVSETVVGKVVDGQTQPMDPRGSCLCSTISMRKKNLVSKEAKWSGELFS